MLLEASGGRGVFGDSSRTGSKSEVVAVRSSFMSWWNHESGFGGLALSEYNMCVWMSIVELKLSRAGMSSEVRVSLLRKARLKMAIGIHAGEVDIKGLLMATPFFIELHIDVLRARSAIYRKTRRRIYYFRVSYSCK